MQEFIVQITNKHKWKEFSQSPGNFVLDFITKFYQNMNKEKNESIVKGKKKIDFSPEKSMRFLIFNLWMTMRHKSFLRLQT
ncbi:hypothetical protein A4A49_24017 [Nicotiana attenuata]|uniref:Uncharacterized protein n=1 Tax=Nicotiana attenuata TaxID=49451 RepID=A0A1J6IJT9_NICAT|nr:hypothetical protein A4A49_24017 [Nicotiana attenuata]